MRMLPRGADEFSELVGAFHLVREHLLEQWTTAVTQQKQMALVLDYMGDGVLIVGWRDDVQLINPAAEDLLKTAAAQAVGRSFAEVVRHHQLIDLFQTSQQRGEKLAQAFDAGSGRFWRASITPFEKQGTRGYLVLLQDLTGRAGIWKQCAETL